MPPTESTRQELPGKRAGFRIEETEGLKRTWWHEQIELRWYTPEELDNIANLVGFSATDRYQDFEIAPYENDSLHMIWVCQKD